ncbi:MAG: efflux RND transporter periplasmic adaptor subunit [Melioribacteraceae bacterium]|nr:efflux RND transporter periplasmic adaptor subunit [Melioribacteraceae bacterium]
MSENKVDLSSLKINRNQEKRGNGKKYIRPIIIISVIIAVVIISYLAFQSFVSGEIEVTTTNASIISSSETSAVLTASGYVVAQRKAAVASKGTGRLVFLGVEEGDPVYKNQIIARLEDSDIKAQLDQAKANQMLQEAGLKDATNQFERVKSLLKTNSSTQSEVDAAEARYLSVLASIQLAKASVTASEVAMENTLIRAPFNGTVLTKNADVGEIVAPFAASASSKAAVVTIADMTSLQLETDVSESNIFRIKPGQSCEITLDAYPRIKYPGSVAKIVPTADRSKATVMVKVAFKEYDTKVLPEMSAKVLFLGDEIKDNEVTEMLVVPISAVVKKNEKYFVYVIVNGTAELTQFQSGRESDDYIEVLSGVTESDKLINNPSDKIKDGTKVKIQ